MQAASTDRRNAVAWLLFVTLIWGATFVWMKKALDSASNHLENWHLASVVGFMIFIRFLVAAISLPIFSERARRGLSDKNVWKGGALLG
jgi:drug/metabolite transporter (DMT)-like permease